MVKVNIYSTPTCTYCQLAKKFFDEKGIQYEDFDVSVDEAKRSEMVEKSGQMGVPVLVITKDDGSEETVVGFEESKVKEVLGL